MNGRRIRKEKVANSKISGYVWTGLKDRELQKPYPIPRHIPIYPIYGSNTPGGGGRGLKPRYIIMELSSKLAYG